MLVQMTKEGVIGSSVNMILKINYLSNFKMMKYQ